MAKFVRRFFTFSFALLVIIGSVVLFDINVVKNPYHDAGFYTGAMRDKVDLLMTTTGPKVILIGDSNVSFGINSEIIEQELNMPVINMGLHGALGNAFHDNISKLNIGSGDLVIMCHADFSEKSEDMDPNTAWITLEGNTDMMSILRLVDWNKIASSWPYYFKNAFIMWLSKGPKVEIETAYNTNSFNKYGDVIYKPDKGKKAADEIFADSEIGVPTIDPSVVERINLFSRYVEEKGAKLLVAGYPIAYGDYSTYNKEDFKQFEVELNNQLECDAISNYEDYFYSYDYFYDTVYHLTNEGAEKRTWQLVSDIKDWMNNK